MRSREPDVPVIEPFGDAAVRVALEPGIDARHLLATLRALPGVVDAVVAERHALVTHPPGHPPPGLRAALDEGLRPTGGPREAAAHTVQVVYDGADLDAVAARANISPEQVVALHAAGVYEVTAVGFLPGFAYLRGLDPRLVGPRRAAPRPRVPPLSVAIAGPYAGVYPFASPGGWNLLGTAVAFRPFDAAAGATLALGDTVRFVRVGP